ncbi:hypothetical protein A2970_00600 [Candidatus Roizmanbacteria bacterium RIFCSPLOWO2_01_FULL_44_13]|uniref:Undecaprenyl-diphosphatase n=1 Tax=Candidatus Roizmanbacteria bacterium RIFCSPLOWO2_01_FULL_44_13 TaxID=1802069 RepID=A0A1F7JBW4_9BACT|nr:MAG: hypothetical protein A2970_00600 [Candidatus Roizmanbacteria bacterium RIFCSPLOWO2_01_FULL_44_13]
MNLMIAVILGIVEGLTEFLPISSTAHLIISSRLLNIPQTEFQKFFEVFIQAGAILSVVFLYFNYAFKNPLLIKKVAASFLPTALVGFLLHKIIKEVFFESFALIIGSLVVIGLLFIVVEYLIKNKKIELSKTIKNLSWTDALIIGLGQSLAVIPGISRAGIVILAMMVKGYRRDEAAVYSFLLAVPTIIAAAGYDLLKTDFAVLSEPDNILFLSAGFVVSFITAYISVKWLIGYLKKHSLIPFGVYRILLVILYYV